MGLKLFKVRYENDKLCYIKAKEWGILKGNLVFYNENDKPFKVYNSNYWLSIESCNEDK